MKDIKWLFWDTIRILSVNNILKYVILIGSWIKYIYKTSNYFKDFVTNLYTRDIDFIIKNIRKPKEKINIVNILKKEGCLVDIDYFQDYSL